MSKTMLNLWLFFVAIMAFFPTSVTVPDRSGVTVSDNSAMIPRAVAMSRLARSEGSGFFFPDIPIVEVAPPLMNIEEILARFDEVDDNGADEVEVLDSAGMHSNSTAVQSGLEWAHEMFRTSRRALESSYQNAHRHLANFMVMPSTTDRAAVVTTRCTGPAYLRGTVNRRLADCMEPIYDVYDELFKPRRRSWPKHHGYVDDDDTVYVPVTSEEQFKRIRSPPAKAVPQSASRRVQSAYIPPGFEDGDDYVFVPVTSEEQFKRIRSPPAQTSHQLRENSRKPQSAEHAHRPPIDIYILIAITAIMVLVACFAIKKFVEYAMLDYAIIAFAKLILRMISNKDSGRRRPDSVHYDRLGLKPDDELDQKKIKMKVEEGRKNLKRFCKKCLLDLVKNKTVALGYSNWDWEEWEAFVRQPKSQRLYNLYWNSIYMNERSADILMKFYEPTPRKSRVMEWKLWKSWE